MTNLPLIYSLLLVIVSAFIGGIIAKRLKQPVMLGYLISGIFVSFFYEKIGLNKNSLQILSDIGIAFLMFCLGLEFHSVKNGKLKKVIIEGAVLQILLTIFFGLIVLIYLFGYGFNSSFILSCAFSLTSTAIVVKVLEEKHMSESLSGEIMIGWLLIQDLSVLPIIGLLPLLFSGLILGNILIMFISVFALIAFYFFMKKVITVTSISVEKFKNRELLLLFSIAIVFSFGQLASILGFSFALGAFLAGLTLSSASSRYAIFSEIRSLRDMFLVIFFVSLGMSLNPFYLFNNFGLVIIITLIFLILKILITAFILSNFKYHAKTIFDCSFGLAGVGEFSFILAILAFSRQFFSIEEYSLVVSVTLVTMVATSWMFDLSGFLYSKSAKIFLRFPKIYAKYFTKKDFDSLDEAPIVNHAVILGYGRVGKWVGNALQKLRIPYLIVEYDPEISRRLKLEGKKVIFGDPVDIDVLAFAGVNKAKLLIITIPDSFSQKIIIANCKALNPGVKIICRSHFDEDKKSLKKMGVDNIIQPEFEAALSITHRSLHVFGFEKEDIINNLKKIKQEHEQ